MAEGPGVSVSKLSDGRFRVRWRESVREGGRTRRVQREKVVRDESTAIEMRAKILRIVEQGGVYEPDVRKIARVATVDDVFDGFLRARAARGVTAGTLAQYGTRTVRILRSFRELHQISEDEAVSGAHLTREGAIDVTNHLRAEGLAEGSVYGCMKTYLAAWTWAGDDPATYPGIAPAPRDPSAVLPHAPIYTAAPAPTLAEVDAVIGVLRLVPRYKKAHAIAVIMRFTGLRVAQAYGLTVGDVDLAHATATIRTGKSRREKAEQRTVPISAHLRDFLIPLVAGRGEDELLLTRRSDRVSGGVGPVGPLTMAWEAAIKAGDARREVYAPTNRRNARPDHAFRAAFQHALVIGGVRDEVIDALVGHASGVRERHYVEHSARFEAMRIAVDSLPPLPPRKDAPSEATGTDGDNVVAFKR